MQIPDVVRVGSMDYTVIVSDKVLILNGNELNGLIDYSKHEIYINNTYGDIQQQEQTFLHELFHAMIKDRDIVLNENEEFIVDSLAKSLHQVIRDNHSMFDLGTMSLEGLKEFLKEHKGGD